MQKKSLTDAIKNALFEVDFSDFEKCKALMEERGDKEVYYVGRNLKNEDVLIMVSIDNITITTNQNNGWTRTDVLWKDGTQEELYTGRWKDITR